jgi:hypothetical protein
LAPRLGDPAFDNKTQVLLGPVKLQVTTVSNVPQDSSLLDTIRQQLHTNDFAKNVFAHLGPSDASCSTLSGSSRHDKEFKWQDNLLFYKNLLYVPDGSSRLQVFEHDKHCHDACMARHFGIAKTIELVKRSFWWPHLQATTIR